MVGDHRTGGTDSIVYVDRSDVHGDRLDELKEAIHSLVAFVDAHQSQMAMYAVYLNEQAQQMTVVSVHPNSASLERHVALGAPEFQKLAPYIALREIEVFGPLSDAAANLVRQKADALGDGGRVRVHEHCVGFDRLSKSPTA